MSFTVLFSHSLVVVHENNNVEMPSTGRFDNLGFISFPHSETRGRGLSRQLCCEHDQESHDGEFYRQTEPAEHLIKSG